MFGHCHGHLWRSDDFSACFRRDYLQTLIPIITCALSLLYLTLQFASSIVARYSKSDNHYSSLPNGVHADDTSDETSEEEEDDLTLRPAVSRTGESIITVKRPAGESLVTLAEEGCVLAVLILHIAILVSRWDKHGRTAAVAGVVVWTYVAFLASVRLLFTTSRISSFRPLWYHTASLYGVLWICYTLIFRSEIVHPHSDNEVGLISAIFALNTVLLLIALSSRVGNRAVEVEYEGDLIPAREPLASVLSAWTFSWVDGVVWTGYKKTVEMSDVWNLPMRDKAASVLADYRQLKKTNALAFHLLKYFRTPFLIQAVWAIITGLMTFVPTLLLKVILQYVEDPESTPRNAAWFYVILLFVSSAVMALANGQALWVGRKICIRLRAVIIGEIYAKALRRRAAATSDKVLGESAPKADDEPKQSLVKRVLTFGRKDKSKKNQTKSTSDESTEGQVSSGAIINLMAVDSFKVAEISAYLHFLWAETPVQFVLAIVLLYQILGNSSIVGIAMMALLLPVNMVIAKSFAAIQKKILAATDARIHTTNEVLTNIRIIKFFAWEQRFLGAVEEKRAAELRHLRNRYVVWAIAATVWSGAPVLITFLSFLFYTLVEKRPLVPSVAFTALSLFSLLRIPLDQLADMVAHVQESKVSVDRVEEYLSEPETEKYKQLRQTTDDNNDSVLGFENGIFSWGAKDSDDFKLIDLDVKFKVSQLNVVIGPTGSGKTSLLMALLGEMTRLQGSVFLPGGRSRSDLKPDPDTGLIESVAYCAQQAWLINGTIRDNILFSSDYNSARYKSVIVACSLQRDLEILDKGDQTIVGEKGVTLSGGQKQRISLARALYSNARHLLLDDVLSAVDSHTAKWIFDKAIHGPLMYHRTCILVTHNASLCLPQAAFALVLDNGRVVAQGSASEVIKSGKLAEDISKFELASPTKAASTLPSRVPSDLGRDAIPADQANGHGNDANGGDLAKIPTKDIPGLQENDAQGESKATGSVKLSIILFYLRSMGGWLYWVIVALAFTIAQASQVSTNVWIKQWANAYLDHEAVSTYAHHNSTQLAYIRGGISSSYSCLRSASCMLPIPASTSMKISTFGHNVDVGYYLGGYAALGGTFMLITFFREVVLFAGSLQASKRIHRQLMEGVTHAKFRFFDSTPLGQIMNRFSKDIEAVDQEIAPVAVGVVHCLFSIITIVILVSVITPGFLIAAVFITILYFLIGRFYIGSSRDLKRLESVQRSPLYQQFGETMSGMTTIRAYGEEDRFIRDNLQAINTHNRPFIYLWAANRWLAFRVDVVGALVAFCTGAFIVSSVGSIDAGAAGLALTYALTFTENVLWFVRLYASNEQNMNAVERVNEYLTVEQEAALIVKDNRPAPDWPSKGSVEFKDYCARYRSDFDLVLRDISFKIKAGEKVGVVGRTGAGKSSMALALFRALEAERGQIIVDGVDISTIGLQDLRENIVMVPQDPTLFTGTIRNNLDPFGLFTDEEIFTALRRVQLVTPPSPVESRPGTPETAIDLAKKDAAGSASIALPASPVNSTHSLENKNIFLNLSSPIAESGNNLSQGQRQLLCLARALLKNPKVLLMDEATASIDYATDSKIQETIREIKNTTITIAHRLQTIIDYDKVLVLDKGAVVEYGDPYDLLQQDDGIFHGMCEMSGELDTLLKEAKKAFDARKLVDDS